MAPDLHIAPRCWQMGPSSRSIRHTKTPVRAGIVAMIANMALNLVFVAALFALWHRPGDLAEGWLAGIAKVPGLHMALALASALASYLNLAQLWIALRRHGLHVAEPGWARHLLRLGIACAAMVAVILAALWQWPEWGEWSPLTRVARLGIVMGAAGGAFVVALFAAGFRLRDLRS